MKKKDYSKIYYKNNLFRLKMLNNLKLQKDKAN